VIQAGIYRIRFMGTGRVRDIFREVFDDPILEISPEMTSLDVAGWDSFNHIKLVVALESAFNISFTTLEITQITNVGYLIKVLQEKGLDVSW
jgi:acyl carrier protein